MNSEHEALHTDSKLSLNSKQTLYQYAALKFVSSTKYLSWYMLFI